MWKFIPDIKVYRYLGVLVWRPQEIYCIYSYSGVYSNETEEWDVDMSSHKVSPRPSTTSWPYKQCLLCSATLLEYEICMDHKEHMDHPSQYPLQQDHQERSLKLTHTGRRAHTHTCAHKMAHKTCTPTMCIKVYQFQCQLSADAAQPRGGDTHTHTHPWQGTITKVQILNMCGLNRNIIFK